MLNSGKNKMNKEKNTGWARKLFTGLMIIFSLALAVTAIASAISLPPIVSIGASPNPTQTTSTIVAVASSPTGAGISWVKIYENNVMVKSCSTSTCPYTAVHSEPGIRSYYAEASDRKGQVSRSNTINVDFRDAPPVLYPIGNFTVEVGELLQFTIRGYDIEENGNLIFSAVPVPNGAVFDAQTRTFSWVPGASDLGANVINFSVRDSYASDFELVTITVIDLDAPQYYNLTVDPEPTIYSRNGNYTFNATWIDNVAVDRVWFEFNGMRYDNVVKDGDIYSITFNDLRAADYDYQWFANDTSGNLNQTDVITHRIWRAPTNTSVVAIPDSPIIYGTPSNFSCWNSGELDTILYINGIDANSEKGLNIVRSAGNYTLRCDSIENENYTASSDEVNYTINKAVPVLNSSVTSPINYTTASDYVANESNSGDDDLIYVLTRNDIVIDSGSNVFDNSVLGAGIYVYNYSTAGGENYTSAEIIDTLVVERADPRFTGSPVLNITFFPSNNVSWGTPTITTGIGCPTQLTCDLFRNDNLVLNPDASDLAAGTYVYVYNTTGNENYTEASVSASLTINKIAPDLHLYIDGVEDDKNVTYNATTNASAISSTSDVELYRNGVLVVNPEVAILGAGTYNYTAYALEGENYTSANISRIVIVNKSTSECFIESNSPQTYPNPVNVSTWCTNPEAQLQLLRNGTDVTAQNGQNVVVDAGIWTYEVNVSETENYTAAGNSTVVIVNKGTPLMGYSLNGGMSNITITYNQTVNVTINSDAGTARMYRNGVDVTNENGQDVVLGVGTYIYAFNVTGDNNYNDVASQFLRVDVVKGTAQVSLIFDKVSPQNYGNTIMATCSVITGESLPVLYRNGVDVTSDENGEYILLGAGTWNYNCTIADSENYSYAENVSSFVINPIAMPLHLYIDGVEANKTVAYGSSTSAEGTKDSAEGSLNLYRNSVLVANPETAVLGAGIYNYTLDFTATQNYSAVSKTFFLNVTRADPTNSSNPSGVSLNLSILPSDNVTYGTITNVTGSGCPGQLTCTLYRNGAVVANPDINQFAAGTYNYSYQTPGNENYTSGSVYGNLTVNKAIPVMDYFLNGQKGNLTFNNVEPVQINASAYTNGGTVNIFRNGADVTAENGQNVSLGLGNYTYEFNVTGNENYSDVASKFMRVDITDTITPLIWFENTTAETGWQNYNSIAVNVSASDLHIDSLVVRLYNDTDLMNETNCGAVSNCFVDFTGLTDGLYFFDAEVNDTSGNSNSTETRTVLIDTIVPEVVGLSVSPDPIYNGQTVAINFNVTDLNLYGVAAEITLPDSSTEYIVWTSPLGEIYDALYWGTEQNGTYTIRIIAQDYAGNVNDSETASFTVLYAPKTINNSWVYGNYYPANYTWDVKNTNVTNTTVVDSTVSGLIANITDSIIWNSTLIDVSVIDHCQVYNSIIVGGTCDHVYIDPSNIQNSTTTGSVVLNSRIWNSNATYSHVENSSLDNVSITNAVLMNTTLGDSLNINFSDGTIVDDVVYNGTFIYNGVAVNLSDPAIGSKNLVYLVDYAPHADLAITPISPPLYEGDSLRFDASGSSDPNIVNGTNIALTFNDSLNYTFYLGAVTITGNESVVYHQFSPGQYNVYVVVTDALGRTSMSAQNTLYIGQRPSGGGGGGGGYTRCTSNWTCTNWSACSNGKSTRVCTRIDPTCYTQDPKPSEEKLCNSGVNSGRVINESYGEGQYNGTNDSKITGGVIGALGSSKMKLALIFILAVLIAGGILWLARTKKSGSRTKRSRKN